MMIAYRIVGLCGHDKVAWYHACSLVNELVKSMLTICTRFSPNDRTCLVTHFFSVTVDILAIAFHISLLEISRKTMHVLVIGENCFGIRIEKIPVPYAKHRHNNRYIPVKSC